MTWTVAVLLLASLYAWKWRTGRPSEALGIVFLYSLLVPTWVAINIGGLPLNVRMTIACAGLVAYCFHPKATFSTKLSVPDYAAIGLFGATILSDCANDGWQMVSPVRAYGEWIVPYLLGRTALQSTRDVRAIGSHACAVAVLLAVWGAAEAFLGVNPANWVFGQRPADRTGFYSERWWLKRAEGPTIHPIWFGMVQALLLPWTLSAAAGAWRRGASLVWFAMPFVTVVGVFFSLSRGPLGQLVLTLLAIPFYFLSRRWKGALLVVFVVVGLGLSSRAVEFMQYMASGAREQAKQMRMVDGRPMEYNETTHRILIFDVYVEAMLDAGFIGYGTERTNTFPVRVPTTTVDPKSFATAWSIDNHFIILQLRLGLLGVFCFLLLLVSAGVIALRRAVDFPPDVALFSIASGCTLLVLPVVLLVEWMPHDFGFLVLALAGSASGLRPSPADGSPDPNVGKARRIGGDRRPRAMGSPDSAMFLSHCFKRRQPLL
jgi:hypothetical protein